MASAPQEYSLKIVDYVVFGSMFFFTMAIGIYYAYRGKGAKSRESYFVGNRQMHYFPVALSLVVTYESSIMMLGLPTESYVYGTATIMVAFGRLLGNLLATVVSVPLFKPMNITTVFEYLQLRFNSRQIRLFGVVFFIVQNLSYAGIVLYAQAVALEAVMGLNMWLSILIMDACAIFYTALGGIKSVVWTDVFQSVIMFGGIFAIVIKGTLEIGGTSKVWELANQGGRLHAFDFDTDPTIRHSVWCAFLPSALTTSRFWFAQPTVQRISASRTEKEAKYMVIIAAMGYFLTYSLVVYEGLVIYAFFNQRGKDEPISCGLIGNPNQIIPYAVLVLFENQPGMAGLFLAALYSASLSTVSSVLNSLCVLVTEDILEPVLKNASDARATLYAKISVVILGIFTLLFCFIVSFIEGPFTQIVNSILASTGGPLIGIWLLAFFFPSSHSKGVTIGLLVGFVVCSIFTLGGNFRDDVKKTPFLSLGNGTCTISDDVMSSNWSEVFLSNVTATTSSPTASTLDTQASSSEENYNPWFSMSYQFFYPIGIISTAIVGVVASYILGKNKPGDVNPKYLLSITDSILFFLPAFVRRWLNGIGPQFQNEWKGENENDPKESELEHLPTA